MKKSIPVFLLSLIGSGLLSAAPTVGTSIVIPGSGAAGTSTNVLITARIDDPSVVAGSVVAQMYDSNGTLLSTLGVLNDDGVKGDANAGDGLYSLSTALYSAIPGQLYLRVSAGFKGVLLRSFSSTFTFSVQGNAPASITIDSPVNLSFVNTSPQSIRGTVSDATAIVTVNGINVPVTASAGSTAGTYVATVPLQEGNNPITAVANSPSGIVSTATSQITLDTMPPRATIQVPANGSTVTGATVNVSGIVNDVVVGTVNNQQVTVSVNGIAALVQNRTFLASNIPLNLGANTLTVVATDHVGNSFNANITVTRVAPNAPYTGIGQNPNPYTLSIDSGSAQSGPISTLLPVPLVARVVNASGAGVPNLPVVFTVTQNDITLSGANQVNQTSLTVPTDAQGRATVSAKLGSRAGAGNNLITASVTGAAAPVVFVESSTPSSASSIVVDTGSGQTGVVGQDLPFPFVIVVTDAGHNRLGNVPVTFTVKAGGGTIGGKPSLTMNTDSDGRALAILTLGVTQGNGNNIVEASFPGNTGATAGFAASARNPGDPAQTDVSGVVLTNNNVPLPGTTIRLLQVYQGNFNNQPVQIATAITDSAGHFLMKPVPVGAFKLMADGSTAGAYPPLEYDMVTVPGQDNQLATPIYLPKLDTVNRVCVTSTTGGTLLLPQVPGFSLTVAPGSATFPGGARSGCISATIVNPDKIPMPPGFGQQPRVIVTIQPVGTLFSPPAALNIPNLDGLAPGSITEMYSYDHDLSAFTAIGTGTVTADGSVIASDPGVGVIKAGWHCGGNPSSSGSAATCPTCQKCNGTTCAPNDGATCDDGKYCTSCSGSSPGPDCCKGGQCIGQKIPDQDVAGATLQEWDFSKLSQVLDGTAKAFTFVPGCKAPTPSISGGIKIGDIKSCCEARQSYVNVFKYTGDITLKSGIGVECILPGAGFNVFNIFEAGVKVGVTLGGNFSASGYDSSDPQCLKCAWSVDGKIVATVSGSVVAVTPIDPNLIRFEGGIKADGSVSASFKCDSVSAKGCLGPIKIFGSAVLGAFLKKEINFTIPGTQVCYP